MLKSYFQTKNLIVRPRHLFLNLTTVCNMNCKLCYNHLFDNNVKIMDLDTAQNATKLFIINRDTEYNGHYIMFFGGEPMLNFEIIPKYLAWFKENYSDFKCDFHIFTNGLLLDESKVNFLIENHVTIFISYDNLFSSYCLTKTGNESDFNHVKSITKYAISINSEMVIPYYVMDENRIENLESFYSDASLIGAKNIAITRKFFTKWSANDIATVKNISLTAKKIYKYKILVFPEVESQCDNCKTTNIMIYPNGDIYDLCVVSAGSMIKENLADKSIIKTFHLGNIRSNSKLKINIGKKYKIIHKTNNKGINTVCPTLNNEYETIKFLKE